MIYSVILKCGKIYSKKRTEPPVIGKIEEIIDDVIAVNGVCLDEVDRAIIHKQHGRKFLTLQYHELTLPIISGYVTVEPYDLEGDFIVFANWIKEVKEIIV